MIKDEDKKWIDEASYEQLLRRWRFAPIGKDDIFQDETGEYFTKVMNEKKQQVDAVAISKQVGWVDRNFSKSQ